jgi:hypothetical protein
VSSHLRLGGEFLSWINDQGNAAESLSSLLFVAQGYRGRAGGNYREPLINFGLGVLVQPRR